MTPDRPSEAVDATVEQLRDRFGEFPVEETTWRVDETTYDQTAERAATETVGGAGAWIRRERAGETEALLVREDGYGGWSEPAGK